MEDDKDLGPEDAAAPPVEGKKKGRKAPEPEAVQEDPVLDDPTDELDSTQQRREAIVQWMYEHGFPIHDPDMLESLIQFTDYKDRLRREVGRPTEYHPILCKYVIEMGERGYSLKQIASVFSVTYQTLWNWGKAHSEFFDALTRAREASQGWWETVGQAGLVGKGFNFPVWNKIVSTRFRQDYTDRKGLPYDPNEPETVMEEGEVLTLDPRDLTVEQRRVLSIALAEAKPKESK